MAGFFGVPAQHVSRAILMTVPREMLGTIPPVCRMVFSLQPCQAIARLPIMRKYIMTWALLVLAVTARAETDFIKNLATEDFTAAGLQKLTPEELARLEALFQRFKSGEVTAVRHQAEVTVQASKAEAEKKIVAAELKVREAVEKANAAMTKVQEAEAKVAAAPAPAKNQPRWYKALLTLNRASEKPEKEEPLKSRLIGDFSGWTGKTRFTLENDTLWVQQNKTDTYVYSPALHSPSVSIRPASLNGFWLEIEGVNLNVRVVPVELKEPR